MDDEKDKNQQLPDPNQYFQPTRPQQNSYQQPVSPIQPTPSPVNYDQYQSTPKGPNKKLIIIATIVAVLLIGGVVAALLTSGNSSQQNQQTASQTPAEWKTVETDYGFRFKAPQGWDISEPADNSVDNLSYNSITVGTPDDPEANPDADIQYDYVAAGIQSRTDSSSKEDFEALVTNADGYLTEAYAELGITEDQIEITSSKVNIGGKEWLQVDSSVDGQLSRALYFWTGDQAITLIIVDEETSRIQSLTDQYLNPIAASIELTE